ncbi:MAG TPA: phospholipase D family protein [Burkholderiaceae bacterium]|nr:phospholipase D family protein [Burkholderiaceae bacterium]
MSDKAEVSGVRLLVSGHVSLNTRLELIARAQSSIDLQVYRFNGDATGRRVMRALRDAAARGVRVRVLVDDLYTVDDDLLLLGLAAQPGVQVRLFNPFGFGRDSHWARLLSALFGPERLHRRMHNKLLVVDGVMAMAGGRNIGDEYFEALDDQLFYDFDVLVAGAVVPQLARTFDPYWNSPYSHDVAVVFGEERAGTPALRKAFDEQLQLGCAAPPCAAPLSAADSEHESWAALAAEFQREQLTMHRAYASAAADAPEKIDAPAAADVPALAAAGAEVRMRVSKAIRDAREQIVIVSPYLIPGPNAEAALREFRQRGVHVTMMTNSLAGTDEPLAHVGYRRYRTALLREGVELYEWSPVRSGRVFRQLLRGETVLRLHAKCALIDGHHVYLGSMNFDPRSRNLNTELGLLIHSPELAAEVAGFVHDMKRAGSYRVRLAADGETLRWSPGEGGDDVEDFEPDTDFWSRLLLDLLSPFVPEELL